MGVYLATYSFVKRQQTTIIRFTISLLHQLFPSYLSKFNTIYLNLNLNRYSNSTVQLDWGVL